MNIMNAVVTWSPREVSVWLEKKGHSKYARLLTEEHCIDGRALLLVNEADLKSPPISINVCFLLFFKLHRYITHNYLLFTFRCWVI